MNAKERLTAYLAGEPVDRIPNLNIIMQFGAEYTGIPYSKYLNDFRYLVDAEIKVAERFGLDCVCAISDPYREAEGFGLKVRYPEDGLSVSEGPLIRDYADVKKMRTVDPTQAARMNDRVLAVREFKSQAGADFPVIGWVEGPIAEAVDVRGMNEVLLDFFDVPDALEELMELCTENAIRFAEAQVAAGADFIGMGDAAASLIGPELYERYVLPRERKIIDAIHQAGAKVKLHICGNISGILPHIAHTGADIVDIDHMVDFDNAIRTLSEGQMANGNYDPVGVLLQGSPRDVRSAVNHCIETMSDRRAIISAGCEVPRYTSHENMDAASDALTSHGSV